MRVKCKTRHVLFIRLGRGDTGYGWGVVAHKVTNRTSINKSGTSTDPALSHTETAWAQTAVGPRGATVKLPLIHKL